MSKEWISDENWDSVVIERKEGKKKKIGARKRTSICDTCTSPVFFKKDFYFIYLFFWPHSMWDLSSLTRD